MTTQESKEAPTILSFYREAGSRDEHWLNRYVQNAETHVPPVDGGADPQATLYYCEDKQGKITIHQGDKMGPVLATAEPCKDKEGKTEIHPSDSSSSVVLNHIHHGLGPLLHGKTQFELNGEKYHWKGHTEFINDQSGLVLAKFHPTTLEGPKHKIGSLVIEWDGKALMDMIVITALVVQERSDEGKIAVWVRRRSNC